MQAFMDRCRHSETDAGVHGQVQTFRGRYWRPWTGEGAHGQVQVAVPMDRSRLECG